MQIYTSESEGAIVFDFYVRDTGPIGSQGDAIEINKFKRFERIERMISDYLGIKD